MEFLASSFFCEQGLFANERDYLVLHVFVYALPLSLFDTPKVPLLLLTHALLGGAFVQTVASMSSSQIPQMCDFCCILQLQEDYKRRPRCMVGLFRLSQPSAWNRNSAKLACWEFAFACTNIVTLVSSLFAVVKNGAFARCAAAPLLVTMILAVVARIRRGS